MKQFWWYIENPFNGYYYRVIPVRGIKNPNKVKAYKRLPKNVKKISAHIGFNGFYEGYQTIPINIKAVQYLGKYSQNKGLLDETIKMFKFLNI